MLSLTLDINDSRKSINISRKYPNSIATTVGIHPYMAKLKPFEMSLCAELKALIAENKDIVKAVGEIGLDYKHVAEGILFISYLFLY